MLTALRWERRTSRGSQGKYIGKKLCSWWRNDRNRYEHYLDRCCHDNRPKERSLSHGTKYNDYSNARIFNKSSTAG